MRWMVTGHLVRQCIVYDYNENMSFVVRVTNLNDQQCSGDGVIYQAISFQEHLDLVSGTNITKYLTNILKRGLCDPFFYNVFVYKKK